jgi:hypothetical protein
LSFLKCYVTGCCNKVANDKALQTLYVTGTGHYGTINVTGNLRTHVKLSFEREYLFENSIPLRIRAKQMVIFLRFRSLFIQNLAFATSIRMPQMWL